MLSDLQKEILNALFFTEPFGNLVDEIDETAAIIADELRTLMDRGWVQPMQQDKAGNFTTSIYYDSDHMDKGFYKITADGMDQMYQI